MAVMRLQKPPMNSLVNKLRADFTQFDFVASDEFYWSPNAKRISYIAKDATNSPGEWTLFHELAHGLLGHRSYSSDLELLKLESDAWEKAKQLACSYNIEIDDDHIQNCLDTYRDWMHLRSKCPDCDSTSLQVSSTEYRCFNCAQVWHVTSSRFCRPYRRKEAVHIEDTHSKNNTN